MGKSFLAPCRDPNRGCPKGTPENQRTLWPENELCYEHYRECRAVGRFPNDSVVRRNAAIIMEVEDTIEKRNDAKSRNDLVEILMLSLGAKRG